MCVVHGSILYDIVQCVLYKLQDLQLCVQTGNKQIKETNAGLEGKYCPLLKEMPSVKSPIAIESLVRKPVY